MGQSQQVFRRSNARCMHVAVIEQQLRQLFATILDVPPHQISRNTDFFEAAGDSLDFAELLTALEGSFPVEIEADDVLGLASGQRTPSGIAHMIDAKQTPLKEGSPVGEGTRASVSPV